MADYVEFYVTTNPPLLPNGVESTISHIKENIAEGKVVELLYEPEVPWFKIITPVNDKEEVCTKLQTFLIQLLEDETCPVDDLCDGSVDIEMVDEPRTDVEVVGEEPHIMPWLLYEDRKSVDHASFDEFRFPEPTRELAFKTVWRGLEESDGLTIPLLLSQYDFLCPEVALSVAKIGKSTQCEITYNMRGDLVYIGSNQNPTCLVAATRKLGNLIDLYHTGVHNSAHLIFTETEKPPKLSFRYFTHLGLDKVTYSNAQVSEEQTEYHPLTDASTLRVNDGANGRKAAPERIVFRPDFSPFANFEYPIKHAGCLSVPEPKQSSDNSYPHAGDETHNKTSELLRAVQKESPAPTRKTFDSDSCVDKTSDSPNNGNAPAIDVCTERGAGIGVVDTGTTPLEPLIGGFESPSRPLAKPMTSSDRIQKWMASLARPNVMDHSILCSALDTKEEGQVQEASLFPGDPTKPDSLEFGNHASNEFPAADLIQLDAPIRPPTPEAERSTSGACLLDSNSPPKMTYGMYFPMNLTMKTKASTTPHIDALQETLVMDEENLMDDSTAAIYTPALMDTLAPRKSATPLTITNEPGLSMEPEEPGDVTPIFGKEETEPREVYETMRQQAGANKSWAQVASSPAGKKKQESTAFGVNVVVKDRTDRSQHHEPVKRPPPPPGLSSKSPVASVCQVSGGGREPPARRPEGLTEVLQEANSQAKDILKVLQVTPGRLKLEARLGRLCINNLGASLVNIGQGPSWEAQKIQQAINFHDGTIGFHTVLTTNGAEAELIPTMAYSKGKHWDLYSRAVWYDFVCESRDGGDRMVIEVDGLTFAHVCRTMAQDLAGLYIHCAKRAWDVRVAVTRFDDDEVPDDFRDFAKSLVKSLSTSLGKSGELRLEAEQDGSSRWRIEKAKVRHIAKYRSSPASHNYLAITMTHVIRGNGSIKYKGATMAAQVPGSGPFAQWFEASIGSTKADELLQENAKMGLGDRSSWTPDQLVQDGVIKAMCEHALRMVTQMDAIGATNHNGEGPQFGRGLRGEPLEQGSGYVFW